jgi:hypothetical protein
VNGTEKTTLSGSDTTKFYSGDCYIFQYTYPGDDTDEILIGTWFGRKSIEVHFLIFFSSILLSLPLTVLVNRKSYHIISG